MLRCISILPAIGLFAVALSASAQTVCAPTPQFAPCDIVFNLPSAKPGPIDLAAEFLSPEHLAGTAKAFWDGGTRWVVRYSAAEPGTYEWKLTGSIAGLSGKEGQFTATPIEHANPGWLRAANVHHFAFIDDANPLNIAPHLWMGALVPAFAAMSQQQWQSLVDTRASQHFNHLGVTLVEQSAASTFQTPEFFRAVEAKLLYANQRGIIVDIAFFGPGGLMTRLLPSHDDRQKWFTYALSRLAAFNVTWQGIEGWETYDNGHDLLKEIAGYLADLDPYKHPRSTRANASSGPLADDGWLQYRSYQTDDNALGAIEQQVYKYPAVNNFANAPVDADTFRHCLWNATMNGQYPATAVPNEQAANEMKVWYDFMRTTRHWELEPFFDVDNGRGLALEGVEYIIYVEKPGPVTVRIEKHGYDGRWIDPATGESVKLKEIKTEVFTGEPPDNSHDWILHISRESEKASMLKSYRFESRDNPIALQEIEGDPAKVPFEIVAPSADTISLAAPARFSIKMTRESKALQHMMFEWTGEVTVDNQGPRIIATGATGAFRIPANIAANYPAALHVHLLGINGLGKVYALDRNFTLTR